MDTMDKTMQPARNFAKVCEIINKHGGDKAKLIPILHEIQKEYRYLPREVLTYTATSLGIPPARIYGVATFYSHFALEPKGKYVIRICDGTACHVKGSLAILEALRKRLNLSEKKMTTDDMLFTVETVSCLGACGLAPAMVVNEDVHGLLKPDTAVAIIEEIIKKEAQNDSSN